MAGLRGALLKARWPTTPLLVRQPRRGVATSSELNALMERELARLYAIPPPSPKSSPQSSRTRRELGKDVRRMVDHVLPPYAEVDFRQPAVIFVRAPKVDDFPRERLYNKHSLDLLFRHFYRNATND
ncbi:hypothetical protein AB1Y20_002678 [Prymnesium parvum]|uniref:Uncharacterized protein n=1 Tax=Prymnesium parvum TaxID=97485 RepID=A0AB34JBI3_PRYPA|mmetsp:Transcript_13419/g.20209  ORF Transcript_13419/g.20209 Transcript_13419/m.20209 type:complete len:127 (+) Transcript_13419:3-383(+)